MIEDLFSSSAMVSFSNKADENLLPSVSSKWLSERKMEQRGDEVFKVRVIQFLTAPINQPLKKRIFPSSQHLHCIYN
jgi:hypothetical protein